MALREMNKNLSDNYLIYPCSVMNISQSYTGNYSHNPHNNSSAGTYKDYPWDESAGDKIEDSGGDPSNEEPSGWMRCPCDEMIVKRIYGVNNTSKTNTIWLESTSAVKFATGEKDFATLMVIHPNDKWLEDFSTTTVFSRGDLICPKGSDGNVTGPHFHFSVGKGRIGSNNGWQKNNNGVWVLTTTGGTLKPQEAFFIDYSFTEIKDDKDLPFIGIPIEDIEDTIPIVTKEFIVKKTPSYKDLFVFSNLTADFRIEKIIEKDALLGVSRISETGCFFSMVRLNIKEGDFLKVTGKDNAVATFIYMLGGE